jgi:uncharacterized protein YaaW (UPF0174 family)
MERRTSYILRDFARDDLIGLLSRATDDERRDLSRIFDGYGLLSPGELVDRVGQAGSHVAGLLFRSGKGVGYPEILQDLSQKLGLRTPKSQQVYESLLTISNETRGQEGLPTELRVAALKWFDACEMGVASCLLRETYAKLDPEKKADFDRELAKNITRFLPNKDPKALLGTAGVMALANAGGFATYTLMSSILSTVSFGALGFGAYTAASSLLSVLIGPVGWVALAGFAINKFGKPKIEKVIPFVVGVGMIRQRVNGQSDFAPNAAAEMADSVRRPRSVADIRADIGEIRKKLVDGGKNDPDLRAAAKALREELRARCASVVGVEKQLGTDMGAMAKAEGKAADESLGASEGWIDRNVRAMRANKAARLKEGMLF